MNRFSFEGRSWGMTVERGVFLVPPSFLAKRGRPNEDGMKKVEWFSYGKTHWSKAYVYIVIARAIPEVTFVTVMKVPCDVMGKISQHFRLTRIEVAAFIPDHKTISTPSQMSVHPLSLETHPTYWVREAF